MQSSRRDNNENQLPARQHPPAAAGSLIMVSLVLLQQQLISHLSPALVLMLSFGLGAVSYLVFIWLTQKEELGEIRLLIDSGRAL